MPDYLTLSETFLMLAIVQLEEDAYGVTIKQKILELTGKEYSYGTLYSTLDQLVKKEYVFKQEGEPTAERGGRRKHFYSLTETGNEVLKSTWKLHHSLWNNFSEDMFSK